MLGNSGPNLPFEENCSYPGGLDTDRAMIHTMYLVWFSLTWLTSLD